MNAPLELIPAIVGVGATVVAAFRSRYALRTSRRVIKIQAGDKEWRIDTTGKSPEEIDILLKDLSGTIEAEATQPTEQQGEPAEPQAPDK
jgi:hypothetical protein